MTQNPARRTTGSRQPHLSISRCARSPSSADRTKSRRTSSPRLCSACEARIVNFDFTDEQRLLTESLNRFVADRYGFENRLHAMQQPEGFSRETWRSLADLGIIGLPFAEEDGGFGGGGVE